MPPRHKAPRWMIVLASTLLVLVIAGLLLMRWIGSQPIGTGETRPSPDGQYSASVFEFTAVDFWTGKQRHWFAFSVTGPGIAHALTSTPLPGPYFGSRSSTQVIFWQPDLSSVRFVFPTSELRFDMDADDPTGS